MLETCCQVKFSNIKIFIFGMTFMMNPQVQRIYNIPAYLMLTTALYTILNLMARGSLSFTHLQEL